MSPLDRYQNDPLFHRLVDVMLHELETAQVTPTEVREAAMVAQMLFESRHARLFYPDPWLADWVREERKREK